eukprot:scaffold47066_cov62-Phaeocystis_antarctica.AAC.2
MKYYGFNAVSTHITHLPGPHNSALKYTVVVSSHRLRRYFTRYTSSSLTIELEIEFVVHEFDCDIEFWTTIFSTAVHVPAP